jgi:hypothetical protein
MQQGMGPMGGGGMAMMPGQMMPNGGMGMAGGYGGMPMQGPMQGMGVPPGAMAMGGGMGGMGVMGGVQTTHGMLPEAHAAPVRGATSLSYSILSFSDPLIWSPVCWLTRRRACTLTRTAPSPASRTATSQSILWETPRSPVVQACRAAGDGIPMATGGTTKRARCGYVRLET